MEEEQQSINVQKVLAIGKRRFWWIVTPALLGPLLALGVSYAVRPTYTSQAFVLVEQPKVSDKFVTPMITDQLDTRLMTLKEQILSRSRLEPIILQLGLYSNDGRNTTIEDKVERLRNSVEVKAIRPEGSERVPSGFYIMTSTDNARSAQQVCTEVLSMFMAENQKVRQQNAAGTTAFLTDQVEQSKRKLDEHDAKLAEFKKKYFGQLPTDEQRNLEMLTSTRTRLEAVNQDLSQVQQQKLAQESLLAQQMSARRSVPVGSTPNDLQLELSKLQSQLASLQSRYTDQHPDVVKTKAQIEIIKRQMKATNTAAEPLPAKEEVAADTPEMRQTRLSIRLSDESIRSKRSEQARLEEQISSLQSRLQLSPGVEEQYKALTRDYESALQFYNELLSKKTQSEMATDLERRQEGEQFGVMDAPDLPMKPSFPNRMKFGLAGLATGLGLGLALALIREKRENFIRTEEDVIEILSLPVLIGIPDVKMQWSKGAQPIVTGARGKVTAEHQRAGA